MQKSRAYRATSVKQVSVEQVLEGRPAGAVHVGLDVGKEEIYAVVRWRYGTFGRPWKALNPSEVDVAQVVKFERIRIPRLKPKRAGTTGHSSASMRFL